MKRNYVLIFASTIVFMMSACSKSDRDNGVQEEIEIKEERFEYDLSKSLIHFKTSDGYEYWTFYEFNEMGKITRKIERCISNW